MKNFTLICDGCQSEYVTKHRPRHSVHYCSKSCANKHNPRRSKEGRCKTCHTSISASRTYCPQCLQQFRNKNKEQTKEKRKLYLRDAVKSYVRRLKEQAVSYKGGKCQICGYNRYNGSLDFHHIDESQKDFSISGKSISFQRLKPELDKCILVCSNCHREIHGGLIDVLKMVAPLGIEPSSPV